MSRQHHRTECQCDTCSTGTFRLQHGMEDQFRDSDDYNLWGNNEPAFYKKVYGKRDRL